MRTLRSDEAGDKQKGIQCISAILLDDNLKNSLETTISDKHPYALTKDIKFSRVRTNASYTQMVGDLLTDFFQILADEEFSLYTIVGTDSEMIFADMYEELFLLIQSQVDDERQFFPDRHNALQRSQKTSLLKEFGTTKILEQDSKDSILVQITDIIAGITLFLREHHGTYRARLQGENRFEQLEDFDRELHMRCEVTKMFVDALEKYLGKVTILEGGIWVVESEKVSVLEY